MNIKYKINWCFNTAKEAEKINHAILKKRVEKAWQFGDWQLVAETIKDIKNN